MFQSRSRVAFGFRLDNYFYITEQGGVSISFSSGFWFQGCSDCRFGYQKAVSISFSSGFWFQVQGPALLQLLNAMFQSRSRVAFGFRKKKQELPKDTSRFQSRSRVAFGFRLVVQPTKNQSGLLFQSRSRVAFGFR